MTSRLSLFFILTCLYSCSVVNYRYYYKVKKTDQIHPVCTYLSKNNGAAYFEVDGVKFRVEVPNSSGVVFFGPLIFPIIPKMLFNSRNILDGTSYHVFIEATPSSEKNLKISFQNIKMKTDNNQYEFHKSVSYRRKTNIANETAYGFVLTDAKEASYKNPVSFSMYGGDKDFFDKIEVEMKFKINDKEVTKQIVFDFFDKWDYRFWPFTWGPSLECESEIIGKKRSLFDKK